jgi:formate--tetrahydrofolate ligase
VMAILALASTRQDLRKRLSEIVVAFDLDGKAVRARDLDATGAMMVLLNQAIMPNLVQTTEHTPALVHAGPFANIAHGTSSVISQRMALGMAEYVVNECGFAADLGAEKYFDLVMRSTGLTPSTAVLVASVRAIEAHGTRAAGLANLGRHIGILKAFHVPVVVALNRFVDDTTEQIEAMKAYCKEQGIEAVESEVFAKGGEGGMALGEAVISSCQGVELDKIQPIYTCQIPMMEKIRTIATKIYHAGDVYFDPSTKKKLMGAPEGFTMTVNDAYLAAGAGFVVVVAGNMLRMPGLGRVPQAVKMDVNDAGEIIGVS